MGIFTDEELQADETQAVEETPEQQEQRERDEAGRFKAKEHAEAEAAADADSPPEPEAEQRKDGTVPQGALHAERERRKGVETELKTAREQLAAIAKMREQIAARKPADMPAEDDPAQVQHLRQRLQELEQGQTRISQHIDTQAADQYEAQQLQSVMAQSEDAFRAERPDYDAAINHVVQARAQELALYGMAPAQIQQTVAEEAMEIVRSAIQQGRNPAELGYQIAQSRGYRPAEPQADAQPQISGAQRQLDAIGTARGQSRSLGQAAGSTPKVLNAEAIGNLSSEEFEALYSTPEGRAMIDAL